MKVKVKARTKQRKEPEPKLETKQDFFYGVCPNNPNQANVMLICKTFAAAQAKLQTILFKDMWRIGKFKEIK